MADNLGLFLGGGMIPTISPDSSQNDIIAALNNIINKLNTWNGVIVRQDVTSISSDGSNVTSFTVPHNLGYAPTPFCFLNDISVAGLGLPVGHANKPLPGWLELAIDTGSGLVLFPIYVDYFVDATNLYISIFNATGLAVPAIDVTYYLMRITAQK